MKLTNQLMVGIGVSAVSMNLIRMLFLAILSSSGAVLFFIITGVYLLLCTVLAWNFVIKFTEFERV